MIHIPPPPPSKAEAKQWLITAHRVIWKAPLRFLLMTFMTFCLMFVLMAGSQMLNTAFSTIDIPLVPDFLSMGTMFILSAAHFVIVFTLPLAFGFFWLAERIEKNAPTHAIWQFPGSILRDLLIPYFKSSFVFLIVIVAVVAAIVMAMTVLDAKSDSPVVDKPLFWQLCYGALIAVLPGTFPFLALNVPFYAFLAAKNWQKYPSFRESASFGSPFFSFSSVGWALPGGICFLLTLFLTNLVTGGPIDLLVYLAVHFVNLYFFIWLYVGCVDRFENRKVSLAERKQFAATECPSAA